MYTLILLLPLLGSLFSGLLGRKIGVSGSHILTSSLLGITSVFSILAFYEVGIANSPVNIYLLNWFDVEILSIKWGFLFDSVTVSFLLAVTLVSTLVHIYSISYMAEDPHNQRFFSYLSLFTFFMIILVTGNSYLTLFIGWEGIGVASYLLINFWFTRIQATKAAMLAFTMNRVGDMLLTVAFFAILAIIGGLDYATVASTIPYLNENAVAIIAFLLLVGASAKSAQLFLFTWLPWSMEGPTPVSALLHAATLVVAGCYLLIRSSFILEYSSTVLILVIFTGALSSFLGASSGLLQNDLKKIIAFSTISQLGYVFLAIGLSQYNVAVFHIVNHAFFKSMLFLAAGAIIHSLQDNQDIRKFGGLLYFLPFTYTIILIGSLSLAALPWLTGFFSKDLIIELSFAQYTLSGYFGYWLGTLTAVLTSFYSFRLISIVFLTYPNSPKFYYLHTHEANITTIIPLFILSLFSIFFGYIFSDLFVGLGTDFFANSIFIHPRNIIMPEAEFSLPLLVKLAPTLGTIFAAISAIYLYNFTPNLLIELTDNKIGRKIYTFLNGKYLLDIIYNRYFLTGGLKLGYSVSKSLDRGALELIGPYGLSTMFNSGAKTISKLDTGIITSYALYIVLAIIILVFILFSPFMFNSMSESINNLFTFVSEIRLFIIYFACLFLILNIN